MLGDAAQLAPLGKLAQRGGGRGIELEQRMAQGGEGGRAVPQGGGASGCEWQCGGCASERQPLSDEAGGGRVHGQGGQAVRARQSTGGEVRGSRCSASDG